MVKQFIEDLRVYMKYVAPEVFVSLLIGGFGTFLVGAWLGWW